MVVLALGMLCGLAWGADEKPATPSGDPVHVDATSKEQIEAAVDHDVVLTGTVESASWSKSGKTLTVKFQGAPKTFRVVAYLPQKEELDKGFDGDIAKALADQKVEVTGKMQKYPGAVEAWKKLIEIRVKQPEQVKIIKAEEKKP